MYIINQVFSLSFIILQSLHICKGLQSGQRNKSQYVRHIVLLSVFSYSRKCNYTGKCAKMQIMEEKICNNHKECYLIFFVKLT